jgi:hypothetical protein
MAGLTPLPFRDASRTPYGRRITFAPWWPFIRLQVVRLRSVSPPPFLLMTQGSAENEVRLSGKGGGLIWAGAGVLVPAVPRRGRARAARPRAA